MTIAHLLESGTPVWPKVNKGINPKSIEKKILFKALLDDRFVSLYFILLTNPQVNFAEFHAHTALMSNVGQGFLVLYIAATEQ